MYHLRLYPKNHLQSNSNFFFDRKYDDLKIAKKKYNIALIDKELDQWIKIELLDDDKIMNIKANEFVEEEEEKTEHSDEELKTESKVKEKKSVLSAFLTANTITTKQSNSESSKNNVLIAFAQMHKKD